MLILEKIDQAWLEPDAAEITQQLERILSSTSFNLPDRGRRLLRYIVEEALAGRGRYLKAYTIARQYAVTGLATAPLS